jgi:hypothetical protein
MKSFICEEVSIEKAVKKAFLMAGQPEFFLVKILDIGKTSIFFWKKKKCKIAFSYNFNSSQGDLSIYENEKNKKRDFYKNNFNKLDQQKTFDVNRNNLKNNFKEDPNSLFKNKKPPFVDKRGCYNRPEGDALNKNDQFRDSKNRNLNFGNQNKCKEQNVINNNNSLEDSASWKKEHVVFVENWILWVSESFKLSNSKPKISIDKITLIIFMGESIFENSLKEKHLCSSLVVLLYEILRRRFNDFDSRALKIVINYSN